MIDLDQKLLCDVSMTSYVKNWTTCMVMYKCDSFGVRGGIQSLEFFTELYALFLLSLLIKFYSWLLEGVVLICEGISGLDVLGNPANT